MICSLLSTSRNSNSMNGPSGNVFLPVTVKSRLCAASLFVVRAPDLSFMTRDRAPSARSAELLERHPHPDETEIRHYLSGNLCRCGCYSDIVEAVKAATDKSR